MVDHAAGMPALEGRAYIEDIRRSEYMIGMELPQDAEVAAAGMRRKLNSALRLLSEDLYSTRTHFVLELVQNADDNTYADFVVPQIHLSLTPFALTVWNNELGFTQENVRALCSVGESTKSKRVGFIGEKGIGFKSVFQVSNAPQIHSNGFHFRFDMSNPEDHLGYVLPHLMEPNATLREDGTSIVLPAKPGEKFSEEVLSELDARLLLFLRQLRRIELRTPEEVVTMLRQDDAGFIALQTNRQHTNGESAATNDRYLRVATTVRMNDVPDEKRPGVTDSEVVLAFPMDDTGMALANAECATFAFLPIREFGFKFCVQADFLLSSAREDIQTARNWNLALRDAIAPAFAASLEHFRTRPALARTFLQYLPSDQDLAHGFFAPVSQQLVEMLAQTECILCVSGKWRRPAQVLVAHPAFQKLVPTAAAWEIFGKEYPAHDLSPGPGTLERLGCTLLSYDIIVSLFAEHGDWVRAKGRTWLAQFYGYLSTLEHQSLLRANLKQAQCIPVGDDELIAPNIRTVFFPLADGKEFGFEHELQILDGAFLEAIKGDGESAIRSLVEVLGVRTPEPYELITNHILPLHADDQWRTAGFEALTGHVRYVKEKLGEYLAEASTRGLSPMAMASLRNGLRLKSKKNEGSTWWFQHAPELYLGSAYQPSFDIEVLLGQELDPIRLLSDDYLPPNFDIVSPDARKTESGEWRAFFLRLGVNASPRIATKTIPTCSPEFKALLTSESTSVRRQTLECLDRNWVLYEPYVTYSFQSGKSGGALSPFATTLRDSIAPTKQRNSVPLKDTYYPADIVKEVFGSSPTYVDADLQNSAFLDACGIVHRADANACIKRLRQIKTQDKPSVAQLRPLYLHLSRVAERHDHSVRDAFREHALIFARNAEPQWRGPDEVVWSAPGVFLSQHYPAMGATYGDLHEFFVRKLGVPHEVSIAAAVDALPLLGLSGLSFEVQAEESLRIYVRASREIAHARDDANPAWINVFRTRPVFLNQNGVLVALRQSLYADDQPATSSFFKNQGDISFLAVPTERLPKVQALLDAAGVPMLSQSLVIELEDPGTGRLNAKFTDRVRARFSYIARLIYGHSHTAFELAKDAGHWRQLSQLLVLDVDDLRIHITLEGLTILTQGEVRLDGARAFVRSGTKGAADRLASEICKMLKAPVTLVDGISRILRDEDVAEIEEYFDVRDVPPLPDDELSQLTLVQVLVSSEPEPSAEPEFEQPSPSAIPEPETPRQVAPPPSLGAAGSVVVPSSPHAASTRPSDGNGAGPRPQELNVTPSESSSGRTLHSSLPGQHGNLAPSGVQMSYPGGPSGATAGSGPSGHTGRRRSGSRPNDRRDTGHRLLSYVEHTSSEASNASDPDRARDRDATAHAAVLHFLQTQSAKWTSLEEMPPNNKGFDIRGIAHDGSEHFIEVKGLSGAWTAKGIALTPSELLCAGDKRERYWLCVVEHAVQPGSQILHLLNNPFGRADQFRFDSGWKGIAISEAGPPPLVPAPGLQIDIRGIGVGTILSVKRAGGRFSKLHVILPDGRQVFKIFEPARMQLLQGN